jgi:hypothetical protein
MPAAGRKPNEGQPVRHRVKPVHEWVEVERKKFRGGPLFPKAQPTGLPWPEATRRWWQVIHRMPHCVLWDEGDWQFALDTAVVAARFHGGDPNAAVELRQREKVMGTTMDARRDLRIRYVEPAEERPPLRIAAIDEYRKALEE